MQQHAPARWSCTLNAAGCPRVTPSLQQGRLRAASRPRQEGSGLRSAQTNKTHKKSKANKQKSLHSLQVGSLAPIGALKIGGMYGTLYEDGSEESFEARDYSTRDGRWE